MEWRTVIVVVAEEDLADDEPGDLLALLDRERLALTDSRARNASSVSVSLR